MATVILPNDDFHTNADDVLLETFHLIWLDTNVNTKDIRDTEQKLRSIINDLKKFQDIGQCQKYIEQRSQKDRVVMIVNDRLGQEIVPCIHKLRQIISIYVYCIDKNGNKQWADQFAKVKAVVVELDELISQIKADHKIQKKVEEPLSIHFFSTSADADKSTTGVNGQFVFSQVLIDCLVRLKSSQADTTELINHCKQQYAGNNAELNNLREFQQDYLPNQALWWYTRESFFYKTLNAALHNQNIHLIFLFRTFISDIHNELKKIQTGNPLRVYRGQMISSDELEILKQCRGQFISVNSFFSTSSDYQHALSFLNVPHATDNSEAVLFEIDADPKMATTKPFADISSHSEFSDESEVLFMLGSIFRLISINRNSNDQVWIIRMALCSEDEHDLKEVLMSMKQQTGSGETSLRTLGKILYKMGRFDLAEQYFSRLLNELPPKDPLLGNLFKDLGDLASSAGNCDKSMQWHQKALAFKNPSQSTEIAKQEKQTSSVVRLPASKRILTELTKLRETIENKDPNAVKFIVDKTSDDDATLITTDSRYAIIGRILPNKAVFQEAAFQIKLLLPQEYPFKPPEIHFLTPIYHPNVSPEGRTSLKLLDSGEGYKPKTSLVEVVKAFVDLIDYPDVDSPMNCEAAAQYFSDRAQFDLVALEMILQHGLHRY